MRKFAWFAFSFGAGIFAAQYFLPSGFLLPGAIIITVTGGFFCAFLGSPRRAAIMLAAAGAAFGLLWEFGFDAAVFSRARALNGTQTGITATVADFPVEQDYGAYVDLKLDAGGTVRLSTRAYLFDGEWTGLRPGDRVSFTAELSTTDLVDGQKVTSYTSRGCFLFAMDVRDFKLIASPGPGITNFHKYLGQNIRDKAEQVFPADVRGFMTALLAGDRTEINEDAVLTVAMERSGVTHIVAVSGMHVSILAGFLLTLLGRRRWAVLVTLPVLFVFMAVSGFSASVVRAVVMQAFLLLAPVILRESDSLTALSAALMLLLLINPYAVTGVGLQLSFASTLGIILITPRVNKLLGGDKKRKKSLAGTVRRWVVSSLSTTAGALALTLPISAYYFECVSLITPLSNLLILWAVTPAFLTGALSVGASFIWLPLGRGMAFFPAWAARFIIFAVKLLAKPTLACVYLDGAVKWWFAATYLGTASIFIFKIRARRVIYVFSTAAVALCVILIAEDMAAAALPGYTLTVLDVGQGECILICAGDYTAVVDCGTSGQEHAGEMAERYVRSMGRDRLDALVLTHYHADHANGAERLLASLDVSLMAAPEPKFEESELDETVVSAAERAGCSTVLVTDETVISLGETTLTMYPPLGSETENERGLAVLVSDGEFETLIMGDMPGYIERQLVSRYALPDIECLVVGHHGSRTSTTDVLLDAVTPEAAVISVGENSYGHPTQDVLDRLSERGIAVFRTDENGDITIRSR